MLLERVLAVLACAAIAGAQAPQANERAMISPADARIALVGRIDASNPARPRLAYPGTTIRFRFTGSAAAAAFVSDTENIYVEVVVDHGEPRVLHLSKGASEVVLATGLDNGPHTVEIVKRTETWQGILTFAGVRLAKDGGLVDPPAAPRRKLLFIGDSVTCGAGVDNYPACPTDRHRASNAYDSYGMVLGRRLDAEVHLVGYGGRGVVRDYRGKRDVLNAPQFFHYSVPSDDVAQRGEWKSDGWTPDAIVVSLGTNDWNLQKTEPLTEEEFAGTYVKFVGELLRTYPKAVIFLTQGSIVSDPVLSEYVLETVRQVADARVRWVESRHFPGSQCDSHPELLQHRQIADDFEAVLRHGLGW
jgi:lysophospholipase L1-like esterase